VTAGAHEALLNVRFAYAQRGHALRKLRLFVQAYRNELIPAGYLLRCPTQSGKGLRWRAQDCEWSGFIVILGDNEC